MLFGSFLGFFWQGALFYTGSVGSSMRAGQQVPNPCRMHLSLLMFRALRFRVWQRSGASVTCQHEDNNAHRRVSVLCKILKSSILRTDTKTHTYTTTRTNSKHTNTHELHTDYSKPCTHGQQKNLTQYCHIHNSSSRARLCR